MSMLWLYHDPVEPPPAGGTGTIVFVWDKPEYDYGEASFFVDGELKGYTDGYDEFITHYPVDVTVRDTAYNVLVNWYDEGAEDYGTTSGSALIDSAGKIVNISY